ncbi:MAG TPA: putative zinc-binding metallopeptidase [Vicinamibacterales bacterium]|nr:putative zinc-binding metallopeptidase [Vicinamibacterales bacterium]
MASDQDTPAPDAAPPQGPAAPPDLNGLSDEALLDMRLCDLGLQIEGSRLEERIAQLYQELEARGIRFRPHFWLSDDWFTPDGVGGIAIPFYLAHPRLARLEEAQMLEVEGGTPESCLKILRHEAGHALDNAFDLRRRRRRLKLFGPSSTPYPEYYTPKPYSKSFVLHLDSWYAQSHPDEDFAETFAVWLTPDSMWQKRYADWPAFRKLEYMDELMRSIAGREPVHASRRRMDPINRIRRTLRQHYKRKREHYGLEYPNFYDRDLRRLFSDAPEVARNMTAARFLTRIRRDVRRRVAAWTGEYQYTIDQVLEDMVARCRELNLRLSGPEDLTKLDFTILLTVQTMNYLHSGRHRVAL